MTDKDTILLEQFFQEAAQQQIADNGFTERVMNRLPSTAASRVRRLSRLWTLFCVTVAALLFFAFDGWQLLVSSMKMLLSVAITSLEVFITTAPTADLNLNPMILLLIVAFVGVFLPYQTARKLSSAL